FPSTGENESQNPNIEERWGGQRKLSSVFKTLEAIDAKGTYIITLCRPDNVDTLVDEDVFNQIALIEKNPLLLLLSSTTSS
ncbi:MAG: hypothetical protein CMC09_03465, partial [Flavobacteriaceae bacterium]|nr:hypothetical protein [Flavobacteriaceae bacterium]